MDRRQHKPGLSLSITFLAGLFAACGASPSSDSQPSADAAVGDGGITPPTGTANDGGGSPTSQEGGIDHREAGVDGQVPVPPPPNFTPAAHPPMAQEINLGGSVITPRVVPLTYTDDGFAATIDAFVATIGASKFWAAATSEYGVGPLVSAAPVSLGAAPGTMDDSQIQQYLKDNVGKTLPANTAGTVYAFFFPSKTTVSWNGASGCNQVDGYHWDLTLNDGSKTSYVVVPECASAFGAPGVTGIDEITLVASHELVEVATDPFPTLVPAYEDEDSDHVIWGMILDSELGDLCSFISDVWVKPADFPYVVQRCWSNAAGAASHDPCVPAYPGEVYFNAAPTLSDNVTLKTTGPTGNPTTIATKGASIAVGASKTIDLSLYSDAPTSGPWTVTAVNKAMFFDQSPVAENLTFAFDKSQGQNGDHLKLTITVKSYEASLGGAGFEIVSTIGSHTHTWEGVVGQ
jgi:hypothetical protein